MLDQLLQNGDLIPDSLQRFILFCITLWSLNDQSFFGSVYNSGCFDKFHYLCCVSAFLSLLDDAAWLMYMFEPSACLLQYVRVFDNACIYIFVTFLAHAHFLGTYVSNQAFDEHRVQCVEKFLCGFPCSRYVWVLFIVVVVPATGFMEEISIEAH